MTVVTTHSQRYGLRAHVELMLAAIVGTLIFQAREAAAADLPVYDHVVIVLEENKDYGQVIGNAAAPYINGTLKAEGADLTQMYGEEHHSEGNYFWLLSGSNQCVGFKDQIPANSISASNLGQRLIEAGLSFKGYSEDLPAIGSRANSAGLYARKHVPWVSFSKIPDGATVGDSSNLRFADFPTDYTKLPTVAFVIPNLVNDMHNGKPPRSVQAGDKWLQEHLDGYYQWAKQHSSLLVITFDEDSHGHAGATDPADPDPENKNRIPTVIAGAYVKRGEYAEGKGVNHVSLLRTLEAMYKLTKSGTQEANAVRAGITDDFVIRDVFETTR